MPLLRLDQIAALERYSRYRMSLPAVRTWRNAVTLKPGTRRLIYATCSQSVWDSARWDPHLWSDYIVKKFYESMVLDNLHAPDFELKPGSVIKVRTRNPKRKGQPK